MSSPPSATESHRKRHALELFSPLAPNYDRVGTALSFGQDPRWRAAMVDAVKASAQERVLDVATGTGLVAAELVRRYNCQVVALDQSPQMLEAASARVDRNDLLARHISIVQGEAEHLPFADGEFDHLTFTYLLRYVDDPGSTLRELARVVRPGGRICSLEFGVPPSQPWHLLWRFYTHVGLPLLGGLVSRDWYQTGRFLARSIPGFYEQHPLEEVAQMWRRAGIESVGLRQMSLGGGVVMWGTRAGERTRTV